MKSKLEKFGKFEVTENQALNVLGGVVWHCYSGSFTVVFNDTAGAIAWADHWGATCWQPQEYL